MTITVVEILREHFTRSSWQISERESGKKLTICYTQSAKLQEYPY